LAARAKKKIAADQHLSGGGKAEAATAIAVVTLVVIFAIAIIMFAGTRALR
jgi:divalent metal cation (Fe/Co/Zn/Cd) transporter